MYSTSSAKLIQTTRRNLVRACVSSASEKYRPYSTRWR